MTTLIAIGALGLAAYQFWPSETSTDTQSKNELELREASHGGFLRSINSSKASVIASEETRVVRTPHYGFSPLENARKSWQYYKSKNDTIAQLTNGVNTLINQGTIRPNTQKKPGLLQLPNASTWSDSFGDIANATYDIPSGIPAEMMTANWRDEYGDAGGFPRVGRPNPVLNELYTGNPWGPGGQLFRAVGNEHRNPHYADKEPTGILKKPRTDAVTQMKQRVTFAKHQ